MEAGNCRMTQKSGTLQGTLNRQKQGFYALF